MAAFMDDGHVKDVRLRQNTLVIRLNPACVNVERPENRCGSRNLDIREALLLCEAKARFVDD